jgi:hypothetical protein
MTLNTIKQIINQRIKICKTWGVNSKTGGYG